MNKDLKKHFNNIALLLQILYRTLDELSEKVQKLGEEVSKL